MHLEHEQVAIANEPGVRATHGVEHSAGRFVKLLDEVHRYPLSALKRGPLQAR